MTPEQALTNAGLEGEKLEAAVKKLQDQYGGLLSKQAAIKILAKQHGAAPQPITNPPMPTPAGVAGAQASTLVSFQGTVVRIFAPKSFTKDNRHGRVQNVELKTDEGQALVLVLWNKDVDALESNAVENGWNVQVQNALVKTTEPRLEATAQLRTQIAWQPSTVNKAKAKKLAELTDEDQDVDVYALVKRKFDLKTFQRPEGKPPGTLLRVILQDESGERAVVAWDGNCDTLQKSIEGGTVKIEGAYVKANQNGEFELHAGWRGHVVINPREYEAPKIEAHGEMAGTIKPLAALRDGDFATIKVRLDKLMTGRVIRKCANCNNTLKQGDSACSSCGGTTERKLLMITAGFSDESASLRGVLFDEAAMALLGIKHSDVEIDTLLELKREYLIGKIFTLSVKAKNGLSGDLEMSVRRVIASE
ncbi:MAG TPA: hypothetical protein VGQ00_00275 [Candidatus Norongarragalinales archaeon]|jgi:hypothetical protein|nr:hypothetical protein [Candidatus Norongarragalinales archaeon]